MYNVVLVCSFFVGVVPRLKNAIMIVPIFVPFSTISPQFHPISLVISNRPFSFLTLVDWGWFSVQHPTLLSHTCGLVRSLAANKVSCVFLLRVSLMIFGLFYDRRSSSHYWALARPTQR